MINLWCNKNLVDSQLFLWKLLSENWEKIEYYSDPYEKWVEIVILNTCSFISSGREEMFQTVEKLLWKKKKVCIIWCWVQYFEKLLKKTSPSPSLSRGEIWQPLSPSDSSPNPVRGRFRGGWWGPRSGGEVIKTGARKME